MAYNKTTWIDDETIITAENMNKIEDAIESAISQVKEKADIDHTHIISEISGTEKFADKTFVNNVIKNLVEDAPEELDTIKKLSNAIGNDAEFVNTINQKINTKADMIHEHPYAATYHAHSISDIHDFPESLPANGGNSDTVNGRTVESNVPVDAKFTDTVYSHPSTHPASMISGTLAIGNIPTGTSASTVALGNHSHGEFTTITNTLAAKSNATNINNGSNGGVAYSGGTSSGHYSTALGYNTKATANYSFAIGYLSTAEGIQGYAEGMASKSTASSGHAEGNFTTAGGSFSHSEGYNTQTQAQGSHAEGRDSVASGYYSHVEGYGTTAETYCLHVLGCYNKANSGGQHYHSSSHNAFVIGNGSSTSSRSNAFRIDYSGRTYGLSAFNSTGADYAEYFEWVDGNPNNEDRIGHFVALDGEKIRFANSEDDYIIGIISGNQSIIGNACEDSWNDMYVRDAFGRLQYEDVEVEYVDKILNEETMEIEEVTRKVTENHIKLNPNYDPNVEYIPRSERKEWGVVGMLGQIIVKDDGTCQVNGYCKPSTNGIATHTDDKKNSYRVMARINDSLIKVIMK